MPGSEKAPGLVAGAAGRCLLFKGVGLLLLVRAVVPGSETEEAAYRREQQRRQPEGRARMRQTRRTTMKKRA